MPSRRPRTIMASAFRIEPWASAIEAMRPRTISEKYSGAPEAQRRPGQRRRGERQDEGGDGAGEERAERGGGERRAGLALARHLVAVDGGDGGGELAGQVDQDGGGRAAVLRAVVDAGEHDERGHRLEGEGDRQEHGDGRGRADAGQHADERAEQHADEAVEQVDRGQRGLEAEREVGEEVHAQNRSQGPKSGTAARGRSGRSATQRSVSASAMTSAPQRRVAAGWRAR